MANENMQEIILRLTGEEELSAKQLYEKIESEARKALHHLIDKKKIGVSLDWKLSQQQQYAL